MTIPSIAIVALDTLTPAHAMNELYTLSIFFSSGLLLAFGLMLSFFATADGPLLGNYRRARRALSVAYLFFAVGNVAEYFLGGSAIDIPLIRTITLAIAASQALLFTFAMLALLDVRFPGWGFIFREVVPVLLLVAAVFTAKAVCSEACFDTAFRILAGIYALLLARYTVVFLRNYGRFRRRMDNYFSDNRAHHLRWVAWSFFAALAVGVGALLTTVFMSTAVALGFTVVFDIFYVFFAIRFLGYPARLHAIEAAMENDHAEEDRNTLHPSVAKSIEARLKEWTEAKLFLQPGTTLEDVATAIGTNSKYLSIYLNQTINRSFRQWVNILRIEEAKRLLIQHPDMDISKVSARAGFVNSSHFCRQFREITQSTPGQWRKGRS